MRLILKSEMTTSALHDHMPEPCLKLTQARCGEKLRVVNLSENNAAAARLREIGFCESAEICKLTDYGACICLLMGARVAIGKELAAGVLVERMP